MILKDLGEGIPRPSFYSFLSVGVSRCFFNPQDFLWSVDRLSCEAWLEIIFPMGSDWWDFFSLNFQFPAGLFFQLFFFSYIFLKLKFEWKLRKILGCTGRVVSCSIFIARMGWNWSMNFVDTRHRGGRHTQFCFKTAFVCSSFGGPEGKISDIIVMKMCPGKRLCEFVAAKFYATRHCLCRVIVGEKHRKNTRHYARVIKTNQRYLKHYISYGIFSPDYTY